jgi:hypothetical protein
MSSGEVKLWLHDDPYAPLATGSEPVSARHTRPSSPLSPDSSATPVHSRITPGGRYKVPLPSPIKDSTAPVQSTSHMPAPSRRYSPCNPLSSLFPLMPLLVTSNPLVEPSPTTGTATPEEYSLEDATPPGGHHESHTPFTPSTPGGWT